MKTILNTLRGIPLSQRAIAIAEIIALIALLVLVPMPANAQSGETFAHSQAQAAGFAMEATVLQVSLKEVEASTTARVTGAGIGSTLGLVLASRAKGDGRFAANALAGVLGGLAGERSANALMRVQAQEIVVLISSQGVMPARLQVIVQPAPFEPVVAGQAVYVTAIGGSYRVIRRPS